MNWDDVRIFDALAQTSSLTAAARRLGLSVATIGRRLQALESSFDVRLLERGPDGSKLTSHGRELVGRARAAAVAMDDFDRQASSLRSDGWREPVRVSGTEPVVAEILAPALPALLQKAPQLRIELLSSTNVVSLAAREAEIAVRLARPEGDSLLVQKLPSLAIGLYASINYLSNRDPICLDLTNCNILGYAGQYGSIPEMSWLERAEVPTRLVFRTTSVRALLRAALAGGGVAILPHWFARDYQELIRVRPDILIPDRALWLLSHRDLKRVRSVRLVRAWILETFRRTQS